LGYDAPIIRCALRGQYNNFLHLKTTLFSPYFIEKTTLVAQVY
jgi:hypothetical protein